MELLAKLVHFVSYPTAIVSWSLIRKVFFAKTFSGKFHKHDFPLGPMRACLKKNNQFRIEDTFDVCDDQSVAVDDALSENLEVIGFVIVTSHLDVIVALDFSHPFETLKLCVP